MHDIKIIRKNPELFSKKILERNSKFDLKNFNVLDVKNRNLIQKKEKLEYEKKIISQKKDKKLFGKSKEISLEIDRLIKAQSIVNKKLSLILSSLPNIALDDVPVGKNESENKEIKKYGDIPKFDFKPSSHFALGINLNQIDFEVASKTSGSRFVFLKNKLANLKEQ